MHEDNFMSDTNHTKPQRYQPQTPSNTHAPEAPHNQENLPPASDKPEEIGGPSGPEPTRYGDWERKGRCVDF